MSGLVLNFVPDAAQALAEMLRVTRPGGWVGAYVWDYREVAGVARAAVLTRLGGGARLVRQRAQLDERDEVSAAAHTARDQRAREIELGCGYLASATVRHAGEPEAGEPYRGGR